MLSPPSNRKPKALKRHINFHQKKRRFLKRRIDKFFDFKEVHTTQFPTHLPTLLTFLSQSNATPHMHNCDRMSLRHHSKSVPADDENIKK